MLLVAFRRRTYVLCCYALPALKGSTRTSQPRVSPARCSCVTQMHLPLRCDLLLRHRPDRYRHLNRNRSYLLRCHFRLFAVVTIAASFTIVVAATSPVRLRVTATARA